MNIWKPCAQMESLSVSSPSMGSWWASSIMVCLNSLRRSSWMAVVFDALSLLSTKTYAPWVGVSRPWLVQLINCLRTMSKSSPTCSFVKCTLFVIMALFPSYESTPIKHNCITRLVGNIHGIRQERSRSQPWGWRRSVPSHWYHRYLPAASFSPFKPFSLVTLQKPALNSAHATTIEWLYWASSLSHHAPKHTGRHRLPWSSLSPTSLPCISIVKRRSSTYLTCNVQCGWLTAGLFTGPMSFTITWRKNTPRS